MRSVRAYVTLVLLLVASGWTAAAEAQLRVVTYNIAQRFGDDDSLRDVLEYMMYDDKPGFAVPISVIVFQEVLNQDVDYLRDLLNDLSPPGVLYQKGTWVNLGEDCCAGGSAMYFRAGMLIEDTNGYQHMWTEAGRYTRRWRVRLLGYDSPDAAFYIYSTHLKAGTGTANQNLRLSGATTIRDNADGLPIGTPIVYAGDLNVYSNTEPAYLKFIQGGPAQAFDPLGTGPWSGSLQAIKHTQSPRFIQCCSLIGGGMNQRFDFQLSTAAFNDGEGLSLLPDTYRSFGNDGQRFDDAINAGNNFYYPTNVPLSNAIADALHDASDHIPVIAEYQIPARMFISGPPASFGTVIQGADYSVPFTVTNQVNNIVTPIGADVLIYEAFGSGGLFGMFSDSVQALGDQSIGSMPVDTSMIGPVSGTITFTTDSIAAHNSTIVRNTAGTVIGASQPSFSSVLHQTEKTVELQYDHESGGHIFGADVYNFGYSSSQALMSVDAVTGIEPPFLFIGGLQNNVGTSPASLSFAINTNGLEEGMYEAAFLIHTSDENLPGAGTDMLELNIAVQIGDVAECLADLTGSGAVGLGDLLELINQWGSCADPGSCPADLSGNGSVGLADLLELINQWGPCP